MANRTIGTKTGISAILHEYDLSAKKKFGQNFLCEPTIIHKVTDQLTADQTVIEIGVGLGSLTQQMAEKCKRVIGYDIDSDMIRICQNELKDYPNVELIVQDFLTVDLPALLEKIEGEIVIVSNLPYYITTQLLMKVLTEGNRISKVIAMMQKEVADRFLKDEKGKDYGPLQVIAPYYCEISLLTKVSRRNFIPAPKVDSSILLFTMRPYPHQTDPELLLEVIKACFSQRRKVILSNLNNSGFALDITQLEAIGVDPSSRCEQLGLGDYIRITEVISHV